MRKFMTAAMVGVLVAGAVQAEVIQWQSSGKKVSYAIAGIGAIVSFGGQYSKSAGKDPFSRKVMGGIIISLAAHILYIQMSSDATTADRQLMAAEHRGLVRYSSLVKPGEERPLNANFDNLLSEFDCDLDDDQKAVVFAELIKKADQLGAAAQAQGAITPEVEAQVQAELEESLGEYNTIRNQILIKYIIAQSFVNRQTIAGK